MLDLVPEPSGLIFVDFDCPDDFLLAQADFPSELKIIFNMMMKNIKYEMKNFNR